MGGGDNAVFFSIQSQKNYLKQMMNLTLERPWYHF